MNWTEGCPLCRLCRHDPARYDPAFPQDLKTRLIYEANEVIVVIDLNPKGYSRRYLGLVKEHIANGQIADGRLNNLTEASLIAAVEDCRKHGGRVVAVDVLEHAIADHSHVQVCVRGGSCE